MKYEKGKLIFDIDEAEVCDGCLIVKITEKKGADADAVQRTDEKVETCD